MALMQLRGTSGAITGLAFDVSYDVARAALNEIASAIKACVEIPKRVVARLLRQGANASLLEFVPDSRVLARCDGCKDHPPALGQGWKGVLQA